MTDRQYLKNRIYENFETIDKLQIAEDKMIIRKNKDIIQKNKQTILDAMETKPKNSIMDKDSQLKFMDNIEDAYMAGSKVGAKCPSCGGDRDRKNKGGSGFDIVNEIIEKNPMLEATGGSENKPKIDYRILPNIESFQVNIPGEPCYKCNNCKVDQSVWYLKKNYCTKKNSTTVETFDQYAWKPPKYNFL